MLPPEKRVLPWKHLECQMPPSVVTATRCPPLPSPSGSRQLGVLLLQRLPWTTFHFVSQHLGNLCTDFTNSWSTAENQWLHLPLITKLKKDCKEIFPVAEYAYTTIPTYPSGQIGFMVCCKDANRNVKVPVRSWSKEEEERLCRYYNAEIHKASFILPTFAAKALQ